MKEKATLLKVEGLKVQFTTAMGQVQAVKDFSCTLQQGETMGIVGESGSGKSIASLALLRLLPNNALWQADRITFAQQDLLSLTEKQFRHYRGREIAMVFQNPMTSLNPCFTVGYQLQETLAIHHPHLKSAVGKRTKAVELLQQVGISAAEERLRNYPHELSGGMAQRVMIAIALACRPSLLIADEPTTALDVTIRRQILSLLENIKRRSEMSLILISHDLTIIYKYCSSLVVLYAGEVVESGKTAQVLTAPRHPYTQALLQALPQMHTESKERMLPTIEGQVPSIYEQVRGCVFHPRCRYATDLCREKQPSFAEEKGQAAKCHYPL